MGFAEVKVEVRERERQSSIYAKLRDDRELA